jgi:CMP-N,N'-diacetyllegionaminic acid synthase
MILGLVPARGGSKGIPRKNLALVAGKPLIQYTLDILKALEGLVIPFVSTDDREIAAYCSAQGFDMEYVRPAELATDTAPLWEVAVHAADWYKARHGLTVSQILLLQPTSPIREVKDVISAITTFEKQAVESLVGVCEMWEHPFECIESTDAGWHYLKKPDRPLYRRQDYVGRFFFIDGSIYLADVDFIRRNHGFLAEGLTFLHQCSNRRVVDIDRPADLLLAEQFIRMGG